MDVYVTILTAIWRFRSSGLWHFVD